MEDQDKRLSLSVHRLVRRRCIGHPLQHDQRHGQVAQRRRPVHHLLLQVRKKARKYFYNLVSFILIFFQ